MSLDSVRQLQALDSIMKMQFDAYPVSTAIVLGVAGGNGLDHISREKYQTVYGVDINEDYLSVVREHFVGLSGILECLRIDLTTESEKLPHAELVIADLLIEYIGYDAFCKTIKIVDPSHVSCVIQYDADKTDWVSESPYLHSFDRLNEIHHQIEVSTLSKAMEKIGYFKILRKDDKLPNGKILIRLDFVKK
ncbi:MAG: hypothetical protein IKR78_02065 [Dehalococcoidales bacterium]|nr:hypothetical protein [Dehalococcoidales bacterium]